MLRSYFAPFGVSWCVVEHINGSASCEWKQLDNTWKRQVMSCSRIQSWSLLIAVVFISVYGVIWITLLLFLIFFLCKKKGIDETPLLSA